MNIYEVKGKVNKISRHTDLISCLLEILECCVVVLFHNWTSLRMHLKTNVLC